MRVTDTRGSPASDRRRRAGQSQRGVGPCSWARNARQVGARSSRSISAPSAWPCRSSTAGAGRRAPSPSILDVDERPVAQPVRQRVAVGRVEHLVERVAFLASAAARPRASRCRSWLPSTHDNAVAGARPAQHVERARAAVDQVADQPEPVLGGDAISASKRSRLAMQPWTSPIAYVAISASNLSDRWSTSPAEALLKSKKTNHGLHGFHGWGRCSSVKSV